MANSPVPLLTCDDLKPLPSAELRAAISEPPGRERSGDSVAAARLMANAGYRDIEIFGILANPANPVHSYAKTQRNPLVAVAQVVQLVCRDSTHDAQTPGAGAKDAPSLLSLDLAALSAIRPQPKEFAIERLAPLGEVTLFTGPGSSGKSLLAQQIATAAAAHLDCLRLNVMAAPAIYLTCEDDVDQLHWRQEHICTAMGVSMSSLAGRLHLISLRGELDNALGTFAKDGAIEPASAFDRIEAKIIESGARLVWLDNVAHLFTGNENDRGEVTRFVNLLNRLAGNTGAAIILLGHPPKSSNPAAAAHDYSGSTAWLNAVRSQFKIDFADKDGDPDARRIDLGKANYTQRGGVISFRWHNWAFVHDDDLPSETGREVAATIKNCADDEIFLKCLDERNRQGRAVSEKHSPTYAPRVFVGMPEGKAATKARLEAAMNRLFRIGKIERAELWRGPDRKTVFGLRSTAGDGAGDTMRETRESGLSSA
jgi:RecA-family ATPase